ncbi:MAG: ROK family glucokinase [Faecousia sp.]
MKPYAFGVDLGGTTIKIGLFETSGTLLEKWEIPTRTQNHAENLLPDIAAALLNKLTENGIDKAQVEGVGMGVPGAVLNDRFVKPCVNLDQWGGFDVAEALEALCGFPAKIVNDANAAALGEMGAGGGKGRKNVVFVTLGTGVGGGVIVDGKLLAGTHGAGGEIGHIKVKDTHDTPCGCGKRGCLEQYSSATGIVNETKKFLQSSDVPSRLRNLETITAKDIFDLAKDGDAVALNQVEEMTRLLGKALAAVSCVCDPEVIVLGGGVSRAGSIITDNVEKWFREYAFPAAERTEFALAQLGNDAGIYGGVQMILG